MGLLFLVLYTARSQHLQQSMAVQIGESAEFMYTMLNTYYVHVYSACTCTYYIIIRPSNTSLPDDYQNH